MRGGPAGYPRLSAVALIYMREMRDQLRDRRTVFTIAVLPLLLYPLLGMLLLQIAQFTREAPVSLSIVGVEHLPPRPPLLDDQTLVASLAEHGERLEIVPRRWSDVESEGDVVEQARQWVRSGAFDAVLLVPPGFRAASHSRGGQDVDRPGGEGTEPADQLQLLYNVGSDQSLVAQERSVRLLHAWRDQWIEGRLAVRGLSPSLLRPFRLSIDDVAPEATREAAFWSKLLPFVMLVWAMTGAFYPAIDLVAGEKERGTLETLLCSPALRSEIVMGKLATVTTFSTLTALLNVGSMLGTSWLIFRQLALGGSLGAGMGAPPLLPMLWLLVALLPLSALFSALALAVAALARSSKEGQYYLMPLMMVTLPLVMLPLLPGTELNVGTSLIPVTGMFLLTRALVEGQFAFALVYLPLVATVTLVCLWGAARWAQRQFDDESVLFRSGEQWELGIWMRHLWRDRQQVPVPAQALLCGAIILIGMFFAKLVVTAVPDDLPSLARLIVLPQLGLVLAPALLMATVLTTSLRHSLRLHRPPLGAIPAALLLAVAIHPLYMALGEGIRWIYPIGEEAMRALAPLEQIIAEAPLWSILLLLALIPAVCEELAFRGFIFSGLLRGGRLRAVLVTAVLFGMSHGILQQSLAAGTMGILLGWLALRTGSVLPCLVFHLTSNALTVSISRVAQWDQAWLEIPLAISAEGTAYTAQWTAASGAVALLCLLYFARLRP